MKLLNERVAVITGSTKGNGRAMANIYSHHGANVVVTGRDQEEAQHVADELSKEYHTNALGMKVDVRSVTEVSEMVNKVRSKYGRLDVLVNNAGYPIKYDLWDVGFDKISMNL